MKKSRLLKLMSLTVFLSVAFVAATAQPKFTDATLSAKERAEDIVKHMTLNEKVSLMLYNSSPVERLGIKRYNWWNEALHGIARNGNATVFPIPVGMAASFDVELLESVFTAVSDEGRIKWNIAREADDKNKLYVSRADDSEGPIKTLRGFKRVLLKAGETAVVRIPIVEETFLWWNPATGRMNPMAGEYTLHYGDTSDDAQLKSVKYSYTNN